MKASCLINQFQKLKFILTVLMSSPGIILPVFSLTSENHSKQAGVNQNHLKFELVKGMDPAYIILARSEHKGVIAAAKDLQRDITKITGVTPNIVHSLKETAGRCVVIGTADCPEGKALLASVGMTVDDISGKWELFKYKILNNVGGKEQVVALYSADRWYNLKLRISPEKGEAGLEVQDDKLMIKSSGTLNMQASKVIDGIRLMHPKGKEGSWIIYNAISAYIK